MSTKPEPTDETEFKPFIPDSQIIPEFTWPTILTGALLGIVFGASSLYLVLKVGLTVSASVPIAVLSITLFRIFSKSFGVRNTTILENNIVQTTGSAGESIAFGVGVTMPALLLLGFEMDPIRVMMVSVLGGLLGILMMIPLRRAFIVKQHGKLIYPEGTACAEVLVAGEKGGSSARMVFIGFGIAFFHKFLTSACKLWTGEPSHKLYSEAPDGTTTGLKGSEVGGELSPELLGVGYLIGPRISALMMAGAILSYFVLAPAIATFGENANTPVAPVKSKLKFITLEPDDEAFKGDWNTDPKRYMAVASIIGRLGSIDGMGSLTAAPTLNTKVRDVNLIRNMEPDDLRKEYLRFIGAGAVAAGGIISMFRALPLIFGSIVGGMRDLRATRKEKGSKNKRTETDLPMSVVIIGSLLLVFALTIVPQLGLGLSFQGIVGAVMVLVFGFLFVTVSSRLTGEVGSSSNPISGMTIATLLLVCLIFLFLGKTDRYAMLTALTVAAVVCIASSNGGTTSQDLKTGYLVGATPKKQQLSILIGAVVSALVIGLTMLALNAAGTHYTNKNLPQVPLKVPEDAPTQSPGKPYDDKESVTVKYDPNKYFVVHVREGDYEGVNAGRYLVDKDGTVKYKTDTPIRRENDMMDNDQKAPDKFKAPQPQLFASIIEGILGGKLQWGLIIIGVLIAIALEFAGIPALPIAVGMYLPIGSTTPIFIGGMLRLVADKWRGAAKSEAESETSPGVLLSSGYIAGGTLCGLVVAFFAFLPEKFNDALDLGKNVLNGMDFGPIVVNGVEVGRNILHWDIEEDAGPKIAALCAFGLLSIFLLLIGTRREKKETG